MNQTNNQSAPVSPKKRLLGYQVVNEHSECWDFRLSSEVLCGDIALRELVEAQTSGDSLDWKLVAVFEGDIEGPSIIECSTSHDQLQDNGEPVAYLRQSDLERLAQPHVAGCAASLTKKAQTGFVEIYIRPQLTEPDVWIYVNENGQRTYSDIERPGFAPRYRVHGTITQAPNNG